MALEVRQNEQYQRAEWRFERIGWVLISLFLLAGLVGLLGTGPLSQTMSRSSQGLFEVEYQRVTHHMADDSVTLTFSADAVEDGALTFELTGPWVTGVDRAGITADDVMTAGRKAHGLERMDQIKWAVLETSGGISVVPYQVADPHG